MTLSQPNIHVDLEATISHIREEKLKQLDKDLEGLQDYVSTTPLTGEIVSIMENLRNLINDSQGIEVLQSSSHSRC